VHFIPTLADQISKAAPWAIYGALLIVLMVVLPGGIAGGLNLLWSKVGRRTGAIQ